MGGRPLLNFSFALNYAFGGSSVAGYHAVNLLIHILASWTLFALVLRTLLGPRLSERFGSFATPLSLAISALWAWHPVQTESVTYISQRAESLMGLFYLLTLYCFTRGADIEGKDDGRAWYLLSTLACAAGLATKEIMVTAPFIVFLYDRTFISGSFSGAWRRHWRQYLALAATLLLLIHRVVGLESGTVVYGVGFGGGVSWWNYALTECRVMLNYIRLAIWPSPLVFDYGECVPCKPSEMWPYALAISLLLAGTIAALRRAPALGFAACWFFLILAPTSSIVPIVGQAMAESRMYLPLAGLVSLAVLGAYSLAGRWSLAAAGIMAVALVLASEVRNRAYSSDSGLWIDTIAKKPDNQRAHNNLGNVWLSAPGHLNDAVAEYREAIRLDPEYPKAHYNLGIALARIPGRLNEAVAEFEEAIRQKPGFPDAHNNLANALARIPGRLDEAMAQYREAIRLNPRFAGAYNNLGDALMTQGRMNEAVEQVETALRIDPGFAQAHSNLGNAFAKIPGRMADALAQYGESIRLDPDVAMVHFNYANALATIPGRLNDAVFQYEESVRLNPEDAGARNNLGLALDRLPGRRADAVAQYEAALRLDPNFAVALNNLAKSLIAQGKIGEAISRHEEALRLKPGYAEAHYDFGNTLSGVPGRRNDAIAQYMEAIRLSPNFASAHYRLALLLSKIPGREGEARAHLEVVLRILPGNEAAKKLLSSLGPLHQ